MKCEIERMEINYTFYFFHYEKMNKIFPFTHSMPYKTYGKDKNEPKGTLFVAKGTSLRNLCGSIIRGRIISNKVGGKRGKSQEKSDRNHLWKGKN